MLKASLTVIVATGIVLAGSLRARADTQYSTLTDSSLSPRALIALARQGWFKAQGIPSHDALRSAIANGRIQAEDLVASAIEAGRYPKTALTDDVLLAEITQHLKQGGCGF
ncbi:MAG: hypothetical protein AAGG02_04605 [Cyanobacteria bacterium P01_H01_bin.15]